MRNVGTWGRAPSGADWTHHPAGESAWPPRWA